MRRRRNPSRPPLRLFLFSGAAALCLGVVAGWYLFHVRPRGLAVEQLFSHEPMVREQAERWLLAPTGSPDDSASRLAGDQKLARAVVDRLSRERGAPFQAGVNCLREAGQWDLELAPLETWMRWINVLLQPGAPSSHIAQAVEALETVPRDVHAEVVRDEWVRAVELAPHAVQGEHVLVEALRWFGEARARLFLLELDEVDEDRIRTLGLIGMSLIDDPGRERAPDTRFPAVEADDSELRAWLGLGSQPDDPVLRRWWWWRRMPVVESVPLDAVRSLVEPVTATDGSHWAATLLAVRLLDEDSGSRLARNWLTGLEDDEQIAGALLAGLLGEDVDRLARKYRETRSVGVKRAARLALMMTGRSDLVESTETTDELYAWRLIEAGGPPPKADVLLALLTVEDDRAIEAMLNVGRGGAGDHLLRYAWVIERFLPGPYAMVAPLNPWEESTAQRQLDVMKIAWALFGASNER